MSDYDDDPVLRALRAPGTADELAGEGDALRAYRAAFPAAPRRSRRALGRLGLGGSAVVLSIALGGGVAAAYTQTLPDPVQDFAHGVLGPVGVPAAEPREPRRQPQVAAPGSADTATATDPTSPQTSPPDGSTSPEPGEATTSAAPGGTPSPEPPGQRSPTAEPEPTAPSRPVLSTAPTTAPPTSSPTSSPTSPPTTEPTPDPEPEPPRPAAVRAKAVSIVVSATKVSPGGVITVGGTVTGRQGAVVADRRVVLSYRTAGGAWTPYATARSGADGTVSFASPPLTESLATRLFVRKGVVSDRVRIDLKPSVVVTSSGGTVNVTATGSQPGDRVVLVKVTRNGRKDVGRQTMSSDGTASFVIDPARKRTVFVVRLLRTPRHLPADGRVVVRAES